LLSSTRRMLPSAAVRDDVEEILRRGMREEQRKINRAAMSLSTHL
jgi:hypothetical protein